MTATEVFKKTVEIYENERYSPISGWSKHGLLPTDRNNISTNDGSAGWKSFDEANKGLLTCGWLWESDAHWILSFSDTTPTSKPPGQCWLYATDFSHLSSAKGGSDVKGMTHFVRRRRWVRTMIFDVRNICSTQGFTCDHCDLKEVEALASLLLEKYSKASANRFPRRVNLVKANQLKTELVETLGVFDSSPEYFYSRGFIDNLLEKEFCLQGFSALTMVSATLAQSSSCGGGSSEVAKSSSNPNYVDGEETADSGTKKPLAPSKEREIEVVKLGYFNLEERMELAKLVLRRHDVHHDFHCETRDCGPACIFAVQRCMNGAEHTLEVVDGEEVVVSVDGAAKPAAQEDTAEEQASTLTLPPPPTTSTAFCGALYSRKWASEHDQVCPFKIVLCPRGCEEFLTESDSRAALRRKDVPGHLAIKCILRPVCCPFEEFGCKTEVLYKDYDGHMKDAQGEHLALAVLRLKEHERVISTMHKRIGDLDAESNSHQMQIASLGAGVAGAAVALKLSEARQNKELKAQIDKVEDRMQRRLTELAGHCNGEIGDMKKVLRMV